MADTISSPDDGTKVLYSRLARLLEDTHMSVRFVIQLKDRDRMDAGYLND